MTREKKANLTIALDAMGGDRAPEIVVHGASLAREQHPGVHFIFYGREPVILPLLKKYQNLQNNVRIHHTDGVVSSGDKPSTALRYGRGSSMGLAIEAVRDGVAGAVVSAGNTGALMAMSKFMLGTLSGIQRPAIASFLPTRRGEVVMLDLGANVDCDSEQLVQFAIMGEVFARTALGIAEPTIGLLNVGAEDMKGRDQIRQAASILRSLSEMTDGGIPLKFHGFVEGDDIPQGTVDVIVTDGFSGNVALKAIEGTSKLYTHFIRMAFKHSFWARVGYIFARPAFKHLKEWLDPRRYNGAVLLGLKGPVIKSHGGTDEYGFSTAIGVAIDMLNHGFIDRIHREIEELPLLSEIANLKGLS
jgi:phosphate acyltransferase